MLLACWAGATACRPDAQPFWLTSVWDVMGTTLSVAAWSEDSVALRTVVEQLRDSLRSGARASRDELRRAWAAERDDLRLQPEWTDVADGYALDRAVRPLASVADSALFDLGGLFLWIGPDTKRAVGIADPDNSLRVLAHVELRAGALATVTGPHRAVTVLASEAFTASAWASALFSVGCDSALALGPRLDQRGGIGVVCAESAGVRWTTNLQNRVSLRTTPGP